MFERLLSIRNVVGLLAEESDTSTQMQLGNFPQALSHLAPTGTAYNLSSPRGRARVRGAQQPPGPFASDMTEAHPIVDPAVCRRRVQVCRERTLRPITNSTEFIEAAETREDLARLAESLRAAFPQMLGPDSAAKLSR